MKYFVILSIDELEEPDYARILAPNVERFSFKNAYLYLL